MIRKLGKSDPYPSLGSKDPYSAGVFDPTVNGLLSIVEADEQDRTILLEKSFQSNSGQRISSGYYFVQCLGRLCDEEHLRRFRGLLEEIVKQKARGNYMEVEPILIAPGFSEKVSSFVDQYNRLQRRKPIQLFSYEV